MHKKTHPVARLSRFTVLSGIGWLLDSGVTIGLAAAGVPAALANLAGASLGVSFVYFTAQRRIFEVQAGRLPPGRRLGCYALYQAIAISTASILVGALAWVLAAALPEAGPAAVVAAAKVAVTPLTMYSNFIFTGLLLEGRASWR